MVRTLLVRGMLAGLAAGALLFLFQLVVGEPQVEAGIAFEEHAEHGHTHGAEEAVELVGRGVQGTAGLAVGVILYGVAIGGILALVTAAAHGRIGRVGPRATAGLLAIAGFVSAVLVPFVKYPANPPGSSDGDTIGIRTVLFLAVVLLSVGLAVGSAMLTRRFVDRYGAWNGALLGAGCYVVGVAIVLAFLPAVDETPGDFPATALYDFRLAAIGGQVVLWAALGLVFGALIERGDRTARPAGQERVGTA